LDNRRALRCYGRDRTCERFARQYSAKTVADEQKANRMLIASEQEERVKIESDYFENVITGDEA
jgi:hypothetical protein